MEINNLSDAEFKTLVIRIFKELSEDLNSIKKIQSETDYTLVKINNLQGNYSRVVEAKNQMIWNIRKQKTTNQNKKKKRIQKKPRIV